MTSRESRIRALAGLHMMRGDFSAENPPQPYETAHFLAKAARIVDAIDALPVPGETEAECTGCVLSKAFGEGRVCAIHGTGKAEQ